MQIARHLLFAGNSRTAAFSLVEVAISLGIIAFSVVATFGLMSVGLDASRRSAEDTTIASIAAGTLATVRTNAYASLAPRTLYFDHEGSPVASAADAKFQCNVDFPAHAVALPGVAAQTRRVRISFLMPPNSQKTNEIFESVLAEY